MRLYIIIRIRIQLILIFDYFENYEMSRKTIVYKLVNYQKNKKLLEDVPYKRVLDLAVGFTAHDRNKERCECNGTYS